MSIDPLRRQILGGFACVAANAAVLPCCLGHTALAASGNLEIALKRIADGVYAFRGVDELMTGANEGAISNLGVVVGNDAVAVIDSGGSVVSLTPQSDGSYASIILWGVKGGSGSYSGVTATKNGELLGTSRFGGSGAAGQIYVVTP